MKTCHRYVSCVVLIILLASLSVSGASAQNGPVVLLEYDSAAVAKAAVVFRNFGGSSSDTGHEVFLGGPAGSGEEPSPSNRFNLIGVWPASSHVTFSYDGVGTIRASAQGTEGVGQYAYSIGNLGKINYIRISVVVLAEGTTVSLNNVTLGSTELGDFQGITGHYRNWHVKGVDLSAGFAIEGDIVLSGSQPLGGTNRVVIEVGYLGPAYTFDGFYEPITMGVTNVANAGRAVPVKWRLVDGNGAPIADAASFVALYSYPVSCDSLAGSPTDAVGETEEVAAGSSGLQYNGDGYWQYNWKTPNNYAGMCRAMHVTFADGITSPSVNFRFK